MDEILAKRIHNYIVENPKPILDEIIAHINHILPMLNADETRDVQVEVCVGQMIDQHIIYAHLGQYYTKAQYFDANIQIPMNANSTGVYIVKVETTNGNISKKISIK